MGIQARGSSKKEDLRTAHPARRHKGPHPAKQGRLFVVVGEVFDIIRKPSLALAIRRGSGRL